MLPQTKTAGLTLPFPVPVTGVIHTACCLAWRLPIFNSGMEHNSPDGWRTGCLWNTRSTCFKHNSLEGASLHLLCTYCMPTPSGCQGCWKSPSHCLGSATGADSSFCTHVLVTKVLYKNKPEPIEEDKERGPGICWHVFQRGPGGTFSRVCKR